MDLSERPVRVMRQQDLGQVMAVHQGMQHHWRAPVAQIVPPELIAKEIERAEAGTIPNFHFVLESDGEIKAALHAVGRRFRLTDGYFVEPGALPSSYLELIQSQEKANAVFFFAVSAGGGLGGPLVSGVVDIIALNYGQIDTALTFSPLSRFKEYLETHPPQGPIDESSGIEYLQSDLVDPVVPMLRPLNSGENMPFHQRNGGRVAKVVAPGIRPDSPYVSAIVDYTQVLLAARSKRFV